MFIPRLLLRKLYTVGSLSSEGGDTSFVLRNRLSDATLTALSRVAIDGEEVPLDRVSVGPAGEAARPAATVGPDDPLAFPLRASLVVTLRGVATGAGRHRLEIAALSEPFGELAFDVEDSIASRADGGERIPRDPVDDYTEEAAARRRDFAESRTGVALTHMSRFDFDPHVTQGNIEHFMGVAQVPVGLAGPIRIRGEHADGEFLVPLATTEGTLVASYNRGMKVLNMAGGVTCTVVGDAMQRAPVFVFDDARRGRDFVGWIQEHAAEITREAESTSHVARLLHVDPYQSNRFVFLRFNFSTGDAAGQNMVGRATFAACSWILEHFEGIRRFFLESNLATDKKASQVNIMRTRGKRVTAEATLPRDLLVEQLRVEPRDLAYHGQVANIGSILSGANNNGLHSANAITALYIATGQDVANVAEASAGILYSELTDDGGLYVSLTIPSLIVATHGGGTGLPTQREALEMLGCYGTGKVLRFAEIVAGVALAGELSLAAAISSLEWVSSHEQYGRNR
jgi:hydroxymethylglutaryl-CoA reductase (NADPH)